MSEQGESTTHGLCRRCLSERMADPTEADDEAGEAPDEAETAGGTGAGGRLAALR